MSGRVPAPAQTLLDFIGGIEAPQGYGTVYDNQQAKLPKPLTRMTVAEVIASGSDWTSEFGSSAAGRYQFMKATLQGLVAQDASVSGMLMTPQTQDELSYRLLLRRGYDKFMLGQISRTAFGLALAQEWASFPVLRDGRGAHRNVTRGQSYYAGDGQNKSLVRPERVEAVLDAMKSGQQATAPVPRPRVVGVAEQTPAVVQTVAPAGKSHGVFASLWARLTGKTAIGVPVIAGSRGDPTIFYVQKTLREKAYYTKGFLDGLNGGLTQGAVAQARKDNGMGDGGIDAAFLARLPTFPQRPVSVERAGVTLAQASEHAPELFTPPKWLISAGLGSLGLGTASGTGLMDNVQGAVGKANDVFGQVQTAIGYVATAVAFLVEHKTLFLIAAGSVLVWKGVSALLSAWIKVRQAFF